jgi:hypothetical protein
VIPQVIIERWARESGVFSARPDAPVVDDRTTRGSVAARLLACLRNDRRRSRSELANSRGGRRREAASYRSRPGTQSLDPAVCVPDEGSDPAAGGAASSSRATIAVGMRSRSLASGSPAATSRSACT